MKIFFNRAFLWVNATQFFDTFNNNFFRTALTSAVMFGAVFVAEEKKAFIAAIAVGLLMLPSFLFAAMAGEIADKYPKDTVIKILRILQLITIIFACLGFAYQNIYVLLIVVFMMGTFAAMLSPVKYSILPEILKENELLAGNAIIQAAVYISILAGTILGGIIFSLGEIWLYGLLIAIAILGTTSSFLIPKQKLHSPEICIEKNFLASTLKSIAFIIKDKEIFHCTLAISWFWFLGTILLSQIPEFAATTLGGNDAIFTFFIVLFSGGVGLGSILCQVLLKGNISNKYAIVSLILITIFLADLAYISGLWTVNNKIEIKEFLSNFHGIRISFDLFAFSIFGGIYIVPLTTMLQVLAEEKIRSRVIAANNIVNALFMVLGSALCALFLANKYSIPDIFAVSAGLNIFAIATLYGFLKKQSEKK